MGNEDGGSLQDEWSVQPVFDRAMAVNATWPDLGAEKYYDRAIGAVWYPVEVNTTLLNQWFWNPTTSRMKDLEALAEAYYQSVGNNGVLLLNLSPDRTGRIPEDQVKRLGECRRFIDGTFRENQAADAEIIPADAGLGRAGDMLTPNPEEYWEGRPDWDMGADTAAFELRLPEVRRFDQVMLCEHVREGQRVAEWSLSVWEDGGFREVVRKGAVGRKCIRRFAPVCTDRLRLTIHRSYDAPQLSGFGLYLTQMP